MKDIDKYMIPLDSIRSVDAGRITGTIFVALIVGLLTALIVANIVDRFIARSYTATLIAALPTVIITTVIVFCLMAQAGLDKGFDTSKINNEYGITVTSMKQIDNQDGLETKRISYLHDGALVNGTLIVKDDKVVLLAGKGDKLTPVKPRSASATPTTSKTTGSNSHADVIEHPGHQREPLRGLKLR